MNITTQFSTFISSIHKFLRALSRHLYYTIYKNKKQTFSLNFSKNFYFANSSIFNYFRYISTFAHKKWLKLSSLSEKLFDFAKIS